MNDMQAAWEKATEDPHPSVGQIAKAGGVGQSSAVRMRKAVYFFKRHGLTPPTRWYDARIAVPKGAFEVGIWAPEGLDAGFPQRHTSERTNG